VFVGFPPPRPAARRAWFEALAAERRTLVFFEAPHRIRAALGAALEALGDREAAVGRELTKLHEEVIRGRLSVILTQLSDPRGEFTVVLAGTLDDNPGSNEQVTDKQLLIEFGHLTEGGLGRREAITELAARHRLRSREVFAAIDRARRP
jgi:16S rRNA (cytidine1402-2'-O)-methyltransferase